MSVKKTIDVPIRPLSALRTQVVNHGQDLIVLQGVFDAGREGMATRGEPIAFRATLLSEVMQALSALAAVAET